MSPPDPIPFDTHRFVKRFTDKGMPAGQAEVLALVLNTIWTV